MLLSKAEFARYMNVSPAAVGQAVRRGRISMTPEGLIDAEQAAVEWDLNRQRQAPVAHLITHHPAMTAPDPDDVEAAQINVWLKWHFGPRERLPSAIEGWAALYPRGITARAVVDLLSALRANLDRPATDHE